MTPLFQGPRSYRVSRSDREPLVRFMIDALEREGCRIIYASKPDRAPFVITFETRSGERIGVVAYAFLATRTPTRNRPADERSFQPTEQRRNISNGAPIDTHCFQSQRRPAVLPKTSPHSCRSDTDARCCRA
jgi:hypothetical protein